MTNKQFISDLISVRNKSHSEEMGGTVDSMAEEILGLLKTHFDELECDFILESLTHLGWCPALLYDDNGLFGVEGSGMSPVVTGDEKAEGDFLFFVEKDIWQPSIRGAIRHYLFN